MGTNKALLQYQGKPLVEHMMEVVRQAGCAEVFLSGSLRGYTAIPDDHPHEGPAKAILGLLERFRGKFDTLVCVPVDVPLMTSEALKTLLSAGASASFEGHPLPAVIDTRSNPSDCRAVYQLLQSIDAVTPELPVEFKNAFTNVNTKPEWEALASC